MVARAYRIVLALAGALTAVSALGASGDAPLGIASPGPLSATLERAAAAGLRAPMPRAASAAGAAADAERGARLFARTGAELQRPVGNCIACHANTEALRELLRNRGAWPSDARRVQRLLQRAIDGAEPNARDAKAQYRGVLRERDLRDLSEYIVRVVRS